MDAYTFIKIIGIFLILQSAIIFHLFFKVYGYSIRINTETTFLNKTVVRYSVELWRKVNDYSSYGKTLFYIPIRNKEKTELKEDIERMKNSFAHHQRQKISAMLSWEETEKQVLEFEKTYSEVNPQLVYDLSLERIREINPDYFKYNPIP